MTVDASLKLTGEELARMPQSVTVNCGLSTVDCLTADATTPNRDSSN